MRSIVTLEMLFSLIISIVCPFGLHAQHFDPIEDTTPKRLVHEIETGFFVGGSGSVYFFTYNSALSLSVATGWQLQEDVTLMGAIGIEQNLEGTLYPLTANLKKYFGERNNQFATLQAGYSFGSGENENSSFGYGGGLAAGLSYGHNLVRIKTSKIYAQMGYKLRQTNLTFQPFDGSGTINDKLDNHFLALQLGIQF